MSAKSRKTLVCLVALSAATALAAAPAGRADLAAAAEAAGDAAMARRAEGAPADRPGCAAPGPIASAIAGYERAIEIDPSALTARRKLLTALYFQGGHVAEGVDARRDTFDRGRVAAEAALDRLAERLGGRDVYDDLSPTERAQRLAGVPEAAGIHFWASVHWGLWGDAFGRFAAARQGVAGKIRDYAETSLLLDETYERGGTAPGARPVARAGAPHPLLHRLDRPRRSDPRARTGGRAGPGRAAQPALSRRGDPRAPAEAAARGPAPASHPARRTAGPRAAGRERGRPAPGPRGPGARG